MHEQKGYGEWAKYLTARNFSLMKTQQNPSQQANLAYNRQDNADSRATDELNPTNNLRFSVHHYAINKIKQNSGSSLSLG